MSEPVSKLEQTIHPTQPDLHPAAAFILDITIGSGLALILLVILFFAGGGSNFIYIDF